MFGQPLNTGPPAEQWPDIPNYLAEPTLAEGPKLDRELPLLDIEWPEPPSVSRTGVTRSRYDTGAKPPRYDVELIEQLNKEYAERPIQTSAPTYAAADLASQAKGRLGWVHGMIGLTGKRVLEIGCGNGYETWYAGRALGADAWGVDVQEHAPWFTLNQASNVHLLCADLAVDQPFEENYFDRIMSFTVWEHVTHPYAMLREAHRVLKPGGLFWLRANLYAGTKASHRYRDIHFPWPHLLFTDDVINSWYRSHGLPEVGLAWVNRLSWLHYRSYFSRLGFRLRSVKFDRSTFDAEFFERFEDMLGRFPKWDLNTEYFLVVLQKPI